MAFEDWSVKELELASGISYRTISDYLAGRRTFLPHHLTAIAAALGVEETMLERPLPPRPARPARPSRDSLSPALSIYG